MGLRWDWLSPVMTAPYVPTLGPVHPVAVSPGLFADVIGMAATSRFLPHDKDRRWADRKDEQVLAGAITQEPGLVLVPTLSTRRAPCVKVYLYSQHSRGALSQAAELGRRLCDEHGAAKGGSSGFCRPAVMLILSRRALVSRCGPSAPAIMSPAPPPKRNTA